MRKSPLRCAKRLEVLALLSPLAVPCAALAVDVDESFAAIEITDEGGLPRMNDLVVQPDGKVIVAGSFDTISGVARQGIARLNADGSVDPSFTSPFDPSFNGGWSADRLMLDRKGGVWVAGVLPVGPSSARVLVRLTETGALDSSFYNVPASYQYGSELVQQPDGKVLIAYNTQVHRLNEDGSPDMTFPVASGPAYLTSRAASFALRSDGKVVISWGRTTNQVSDIVSMVGAYNANGTWDMTFHDGTVNHVHGMEAPFPPRAVAYGDERVLLCGRFTSIGVGDAAVARTNIARLSAEGKADLSFQTPDDPRYLDIRCPLVDNGKIFIVRKLPATQRDHLERLNADGSLDDSFSDTEFYGDITEVASYPGGKLMVAGNFMQVGGVARGYVVRLFGSKDVSSPDAGTGGATDAGTENDASTGGGTVDAGVGASNDSGASSSSDAGNDGGSPAVSDKREGGGCTLGGPQPALHGSWLALLGAALWLRRSRRSEQLRRR